LKLAAVKKQKVQAIVKDVSGRSMLFGFEMKSKSSPKYSHKWLLAQPYDLSNPPSQRRAEAQDAISDGAVAGADHPENAPTEPNGIPVGDDAGR
jgi:hypothetical protein